MKQPPGGGGHASHAYPLDVLTFFGSDVAAVKFMHFLRHSDVLTFLGYPSDVLTFSG